MFIYIFCAFCNLFTPGKAVCLHSLTTEFLHCHWLVHNNWLRAFVDRVGYCTTIDTVLTWWLRDWELQSIVFKKHCGVYNPHNSFIMILHISGFNLYFNFVTICFRLLWDFSFLSPLYQMLHPFPFYCNLGKYVFVEPMKISQWICGVPLISANYHFHDQLLKMVDFDWLAIVHQWFQIFYLSE